MEWIKIKNIEASRFELPKDGQFLALWKGAICLAEYDEDEGRFFISMYPAQYPGSVMIKQDREHKFTHYMKLETPIDY